MVRSCCDVIHGEVSTGDAARYRVGGVLAGDRQRQRVGIDLRGSRGVAEESIVVAAGVAAECLCVGAALADFSLDAPCGLPGSGYRDAKQHASAQAERGGLAVSGCAERPAGLDEDAVADVLQLPCGHGERL